MQRTRAPPYGSSTQTITAVPSRDDAAGQSGAAQPEAGPSGGDREGDGEGGGREAGRLVLRGRPTRRQRVQWEEGTVDNEGMGKKKSKICCIYRKPRPFDESSDESGSDSDASASSCDAHPNGHHHHHGRRRPDADGQGEGGSGDGMRAREGGGGAEVATIEPAAPPNAYEAEPKGKGKA